MKLFHASAIVLLLTVLASAQVRSRETEAEKTKLIALENAWNQAQIHRDGQALDSLLADTFVYTDWDGTVMNKSRFIADIKDPTVETTLVANEGVDVYFYPGHGRGNRRLPREGEKQGPPVRPSRALHRHVDSDERTMDLCGQSHEFGGEVRGLRRRGRVSMSVSCLTRSKKIADQSLCDEIRVLAYVVRAAASLAVFSYGRSPRCGRPRFPRNLFCSRSRYT
jgi:hypothetical protein